jgi:hypothetical protein
MRLMREVILRIVVRRRRRIDVLKRKCQRARWSSVWVAHILQWGISDPGHLLGFN